MSVNYIEGIVVFYKGSELAEMSKKASAYHGERAESYRKLASEFRKLKQGELQGLSAEAQIYSMKSGGGRDPGTQAEEESARHERQKRLHDHLAAHYDTEAKYGLTISDLTTYGLSPH